MPATTREDLLSAMVVPPPPGEELRDPQTKLKRLPVIQYGITRRLKPLSEDQLKTVIEVLDQCSQEWSANTSNLRAQLLRANNLMEGVKDPKDFPWPDSSNIHVPLIETHISILHAGVASTMLEMDPIYYVKSLIPDLDGAIDPDIEKFLNWVCKIQLKIDSTISDIYFNAYRDGTGIGDLDWVEEYAKRFDIARFMAVEEFVQRFPTPKDAGLSDEAYSEYVQVLTEGNELQLRVEQLVPKYIGPRLRVVELKDFVVVPVTSPDPEYALFVGDMFIQRADYFRRRINRKTLIKEATEKMLAQPGIQNSPNIVSQAQDTIEGIARTRVTKADEYYCMQGILNIDLDGDNEEEKYLVMFHPQTKQLLWIEDYPYWHNRCKYIIWRFEKRANRLLGRSIPFKLWDINEEIDIQHNQRIDSRTITTVPSFKKKDNIMFDPTRKDQRFYPGVTFTVRAMDDLQQFEIKQTDLGTSLQEEQNLFQIADAVDGASQLRSGRESTRDPRAPAKKVALLIQQSNIRLDDHMRELKLGTAECGYQILELYYQYGPEMISFGKQDPNDPTVKFVKAQIQRAKLRNSNMHLEVARTSVMDNPDQIVQREMMSYQLLVKDPLVGQLFSKRREALLRLLRGMREPRPEKLIPTYEEAVKELIQQQQLLASGMASVQAMGTALAGAGQPGGKGGDQPGPRPRTDGTLAPNPPEAA